MKVKFPTMTIGDGIFDFCMWHRWEYENSQDGTIWRTCRVCKKRQWWKTISKAWSSSLEPLEIDRIQGRIFE